MRDDEGMTGSTGSDGFENAGNGTSSRRHDASATRPAVVAADGPTAGLDEWDAEMPDGTEGGEVAPPSAHHIELPTLLLSSPRAADLARPLSEELAEVLFGAPLDETLAERPELEATLLRRARRLAERAYPPDRVTARSTDRWIDHEARSDHHRALLAVYQQHVRLPHLGAAINQFHPLSCQLMAILEGAWERDMLARARAPRRARARRAARGPGRRSWSGTSARRSRTRCTSTPCTLPRGGGRPRQLEWFLRLEAAGEAAFDDLVALAQVGTRGEVKIEMATQLLGRDGQRPQPRRAHAPVPPSHRRAAAHRARRDELPWHVLAGVNVMLWSCIPRRNAFRAQGTLGAVELLAPQRCTRLVHGALRVGIEKKTMSYYGAHAIIDVGHAEGWLAHVVRPQVAELPSARTGIAEGLLLRADASLDYFDYALAGMRAL